ncbi:hypothetical protein VPH35_093308 [Triticum aestivum]
MARSSRPWRRSAPGQDQEAAGVSLIHDPDAMELLVKVGRAVAAGAAAELEAGLRGGLAEPIPVGVDGVPGVVGDPVARPKVPGQVHGAQRLSQRVHDGGVQRDGGVLLGAVPGELQLGRHAGAQRGGPCYRLAFHRQACPALARRPLPCLQHLRLVAQQL